MRGRRSVVEDYGKESIDESEIPFTVHRRVGTFILSRKASFVFTGRSSILLDTQLFALCILRLNFYPSILRERYKELLKTRISFSHQEEKHQQSYLSGIVEW